MLNVIRKISLSLAVLAAGAYASAQSGFSVISGQWVEPELKKLSLYEFKNGALEEVATSAIDANGRFGFAFYPKAEGFYIIGFNPQSATYRYVCYLKPGDAFNFRIEGTSYSLTGKNTKENIELEKWNSKMQPISSRAVYFSKIESTYEDFFPLLESMLPSLQKYPAAKTSNARFNKAFENYKRYNLPDMAIHYLNTPRTKHPGSNDYIDYYRQLDIPALTTDSSILTYPGGLGLIDNTYIALLRTDRTIESKDMWPRMKVAADSILLGNYISNDTIKGEFMLHKAEQCKRYDEIMDFKAKFEKFLITDEQQRRFRMILGNFDDNSPGHEAIDFKFPDINGKMVALSDFKGKVVYVDVWATWCGPCKAEIPHMAKLEEEYAENPNIVFMSVSIDQAKDIEKWKTMVKEKNMKGVQLFSGDRKQEISSAYKINAIPRFMIIGKDGKIVDSNAPRPSSDKIRRVLNTELKK